jgi:hypothetical protein
MLAFTFSDSEDHSNLYTDSNVTDIAAGIDSIMKDLPRTGPSTQDHPDLRKPDHRTEQAMLLLRNIASRIHQLEETLSISPPQHLPEWLCTEMEAISQALDGVTRQAGIVDMEKRSLRARLNTINEQYYHEDQPANNQPVEFNAGRNLFWLLWLPDIHLS